MKKLLATSIISVLCSGALADSAVNSEHQVLHHALSAAIDLSALIENQKPENQLCAYHLIQANESLATIVEHKNLTGSGATLMKAAGQYLYKLFNSDYEYNEETYVKELAESAQQHIFNAKSSNCNNAEALGPIENEVNTIKSLV